MAAVKVGLAVAPSWYSHAPPLGLGLIKSHLRGFGHDVFIKDLSLEFVKELRGREREILANTEGALRDGEFMAALFARHSGLVDRLVDELLESGAEMFGFSLYFTNWHATLEFSRRIKRADPSRLIVWGGPECIRQADRLMEERLLNQCLDAIIPGEGEIAMQRLLERREGASLRPSPGAWVKNDGRWIDGGPPEPLSRLDALPDPDFSDLALGDYLEPRELPTYFSRGCFKKCTFCDVEVYWGKWINRSGERVFAELERSLEAHPEISGVLFCDSILNADVKALERFCDLAIEAAGRGLRPFSWHGYAVIRGDMTPALLEKMRRVGCMRLMIGIESGSQRVLDSMKKQYRVATAERVLRDIRASGIETSVLLMVGFPTETDEDFEETIDFLRRNASSISSICPSESFTYIDNNTYLRKHAFEEYGVDRDSFHPDFWSSQSGRNDYPERLRRFEKLCAAAASFGIAVGDSMHRISAEKETRLRDYERFRSAFASGRPS